MHLRQGVRWSDGEPFTADDVVFGFDDVIANSELYPVPASRFVIADEVGEIEKVDDYTVRFIFREPHGLFLKQMATPGEPDSLLAPRHYMEQFHADYNDNVEELIEEEGFADWMELFENKNTSWDNPDRPTLNAWRVVSPMGEGDRVVLERNPYYWKVDPEESQLPYIDQVNYPLINDLEVVVLRASSGEIDFLHPTFTGGAATSANRPVLAEGRAEGDYEFVESTSSTMNQMIIAFNLTHEDAALREVFNNRDFRIGLSHAINRGEIIDTVFQQQGEPWQAAPRAEAEEVYDEEMAKQYTEFDPALADEHLDRAGYTERDGAGFRMGPNGDRIRFNMDVVTEEPEQISALELVKQTWDEVGIDMQINTIDRTLFYDRKAANLHDAGVWTGDGGYGGFLLEPRWYFPFSEESLWAIQWQSWYNSRGEEGEEPPEPAQQQMRLYNQLRATIDEEEQLELFRQILRIAKEQFWVIGTVLDEGTYGTVKNTFHNVPESMPGSWLYPSPGPTRPEQYWTEA